MICQTAFQVITPATVRMNELLKFNSYWNIHCTAIILYFSIIGEILITKFIKFFFGTGYIFITCRQ